jgi:hypothetical protein
MARKDEARPRDADLDQRPFGDSHFGEARRERRNLERPRLSPRAVHAARKSESGNPGGLDAPSPYSWHEGCFEDLDRSLPRRGRPPVRRRPTRAGDIAAES